MLIEGMLRANTRLRFSDDLPEETKFPIILPKNHPVTKLIVKYHHEKEGHEMGLILQLTTLENGTSGNSWPRAGEELHKTMRRMSKTVQKTSSYPADGTFTKDTPGEDNEALY